MSWRPPWEDGQPYSDAHPEHDAKGKTRGGIEIARKDKPEYYLHWVQDHLPPKKKAKKAKTHGQLNRNQREKKQKKGSARARQAARLAGQADAAKALLLATGGEGGQNRVRHDFAEQIRGDLGHRAESNHATRFHDAGAAVIFGLHYGVTEGHQVVNGARMDALEHWIDLLSQNFPRPRQREELNRLYLELEGRESISNEKWHDILAEWSFGSWDRTEATLSQILILTLVKGGAQSG